MAVFGVRAVSVAAGLAGTWVLARLFVRSGVRRPVWPAVLGAVGALVQRRLRAYDLRAGRRDRAARRAVRTPDRASRRCARRWRRWPVPSPGCSWWWRGRRICWTGSGARAPRSCCRRSSWSAAVTLLFPFQGEQPMATGKLWMPLVASAAVAVAAPRA